MRPFHYQAPSPRVVLRPGARADLPSEVARLKASRVLVLSTPGQKPLAQAVQGLFAAKTAALFAKAVMHVPIEVVAEARGVAQDIRADVALAVGGGSTLGLAKALAVTLDIPIVALPTTYSGSEMTSIYGLTADGLKQTQRDERARPKVVVYDPELSTTLPARVTVTSGINAMAHAVEALYADDRNPITSLLAEASIRALAQSLPRLVAAPADLDARGDALYAACLAGMALGAVSMALHHKLCHTLGGSFDLPHADVHTVILPHAVRYNAEAAVEPLRIVARALGVSDAAQGLFDLARRLGGPTSLREIGMREADIDRAVDLATQSPYPNPRPLEREPLRALLRRAFAGERP